MTQELDDLKLKAYDRQRRLAWMLSLAGIVPLAVIAVILLVAGGKNAISEPLLGMFRVYSAITLSFLGGIRWGAALYENLENTVPGARNSALLWAVLPAIAGLLGVLLPTSWGLLLLLLAFSAMGAWDSLSANAGLLPRWFATIRITLTILAVICHVLAMVAVY